MTLDIGYLSLMGFALAMFVWPLLLKDLPVVLAAVSSVGALLLLRLSNLPGDHSPVALVMFHSGVTLILWGRAHSKQVYVANVFYCVGGAIAYVSSTYL